MKGMSEIKFYAFISLLISWSIEILLKFATLFLVIARRLNDDWSWNKIYKFQSDKFYN